MPKSAPEKIVFTNGCFDILHPGHLDLLKQAKSLGTKLIVGLNSDRSVRNLKGASRPVLDQNSRREILEALKCVDEVRIFDDNTPENLIREIKPDVLVKGGDWSLDEIVGAKYVADRGGEVRSIAFKRQQSTSRILEKIGENDSGQAAKSADSPAVTDLRQFIAERLDERHQILMRHEENICGIVEAVSKAARQENSIGILLESGNFDKNSLEKVARQIPGSHLINLQNELEFSKKYDLAVFIGGFDSFAANEDISEKLMFHRNRGGRLILIGNKLDKKLLALADVSLDVKATTSRVFDEAASIIFNVIVEYIEGK